MKQAIKTTLNSTTNYIKDYPVNFTKSTPKWAKVCRNIGIVCTAIGGGIISAPVAFPAVIISAAGYLTFGGTVATLLFQGYKKTE